MYIYKGNNSLGVDNGKDVFDTHYVMIIKALLRKPILVQLMLQVKSCPNPLKF